MKAKRRRRQVFVFTNEEKKVAACVLGALLLGLATQHFRSSQPAPPPAPSPRLKVAKVRTNTTALSVRPATPLPATAGTED